MQDCAMRAGGEGFWAAGKIRQVAAAIKNHILPSPFPNNEKCHTFGPIAAPIFYRLQARAR
jgi:hypothetical protein